MKEYQATGGTVFSYDAEWDAENVMIRRLQGQTVDWMDVPAIDLIQFVAECYVKPAVIKGVQEAEPEDILSAAAWRRK